jgi:hypothetical protein
MEMNNASMDFNHLCSKIMNSKWHVCSFWPHHITAYTITALDKVAQDTLPSHRFSYISILQGGGP